jgi:hypothetical protein
MKKTKLYPSTLKLALAAALLCLLASSCAGRQLRQSGPSDLRAMPYKQASVYSVDIPASLAKPVSERIGAAPELLLGYLREVEGNPSYASYAPTEAERGLFSSYYERLPPKFKAAFESQVLGVYWISNFKGGGMSDYVFEKDGTSRLILILNPKILQLSLADWIAYRDASAYDAAGSGLSLKSTCPGSSSCKGLLHTLTHEAAHIYDFANHATPYVEKHLATEAAATDKAFTAGIWESYAKPIAAYAIPDRERLAPYGLGKALPLSAAIAQYKALAATPFYSLYGSASWAEDFAEAATWTWLGEKLGIGYEVEALKDGAVVASFRPDIGRSAVGRQAAIREALE